MSYLEGLFSLSGKVAAVIGGSGVLGGAMAYGLAQAGARVAILGQTREKIEARVRTIKDSGGEAIGILCNASHRAALEKACEEIVAVWNGVHVLINGSGVNSTTPFFEIGEEEWDRILDVNLKSMFLAGQVFAKQMIKQNDGGSIINISSASSGPPLSKVFTYAISKAGCNNLTQYLAREFAPHKIRVNAIVPGFFPAEQNRKILTKERSAAIFAHTPMARFGEADELVGATIWLASEKASSFVTGAIVRVDGGFSAMTI
ncbi:MAG TPA: SDR family oxidoreductase [bacterium]